MTTAFALILIAAIFSLLGLAIHMRGKDPDCGLALTFIGAALAIAAMLWNQWEIDQIYAGLIDKAKAQEFHEKSNNKTTH